MELAPAVARVLANINQEDLAFITQGNHKAYVSIEGFHEKTH